MNDLTKERAFYETKIINGYNFLDHWGLQTHPLFISFSKTNKPLYMHFDEVPYEGSLKIACLTDVRNALYENEWAFEPRYWKPISLHIQTMINIPWT